MNEVARHMPDIATFLRIPHDAQWHEAAGKFWDELLTQRYGQRGRGAVAIRAPRILEIEKAPYTAVLHQDSPNSGGYGGTSFVVFPSSTGSCFGLVVGTQGLAPDEDILTRPGHARRCRAYSKWVHAESKGTIRSWSKADPTRIDLPLPNDVRSDWQGWAAATRAYGNVMYLLVQPAEATSDVIEKAFLALLDAAMADRDVQPLKSFAGESQQISNEVMAGVLTSPSEDEVRQQLQARQFVILQGPPGVGNTRLATRLMSTAYAGRASSFQFHPSMGYEQFIGGLAPAEANGQFGFRPMPGLLMRAISDAQRCAPEPWLLHLDEINRADLARVLGEALMLFEPARPGDEPRSVRLPYDYGPPWGNSLALPKNLHVLGTMNSADRSTAILDLAVRRRFAFMQLWPDRAALAQSSGLAKQAFERLQRLFIDDAAESVLELMPGQAYFLAPTDHEARDRLRYELTPLLKSYLQQGLVPGLAEGIDSYLQWLQSQ